MPVPWTPSPEPLRAATRGDSSSSPGLPAEPEAERGEAARWVDELSSGAPLPSRSAEEWRRIARAVASALLAAESWPGASGPPKVLLDRIAHRLLAPGAQVARGALAGALVAELEKAAGVNERIFLFRELALVGSGDEVPVLSGLLAKAEEPVRGYALGALEANPSPAAARALAEALERAGSTPERVALLNALGRRGETEALERLEKHAASEDDEVAAAALCAIACTGAERAADVLGAACSTARPSLRPEAEKAALLAAERLRGRGLSGAASRILERIEASSALPLHREAARRAVAALERAKG